MAMILPAERARTDLRQIEALAGELRRTIAPVLEAVAGVSPRPTRISRAIGLDKSLASRLVRAVTSSSDLDLMHLVPSPGGLRIFADLASRYADPASISNLLGATERFEQLLDTVPGGRTSIDAQISDTSNVALRKREHIAKQASFKSMSFLLGHFCDVLSTTLFLVPSSDGRRVDGIEIQRRIGLRRLRPSTPLVLLSIWGDPDDAMTENAISFETLDGHRGPANPAGFLLPAFSTQPLPRLDVMQEGDMTALVLAGDPAIHAPSQLTSTMIIRNGWPVEPESRVHSLRGYVLHTPCRQVVRDVYIAESLYPDAASQVSFVLPGPRPSMRTPGEDGRRHYSEVDLARSIEHHPLGPQKYEIPGVVNHSAVVRHVLERTGHGLTPFRGWRLTMTYPITLIEMIWFLTHPSHVHPADNSTSPPGAMR
ncbi:MAG TPA: hypothetical protein VFQ05_00240 [Candidatus Eisenbacteria bacterium]|nr:hypothetical protein [Candidatus Eisenbacteria bacterium]